MSNPLQTGSSFKQKIKTGFEKKLPSNRPIGTHLYRAWHSDVGVPLDAGVSSENFDFWPLICRILHHVRRPSNRWIGVEAFEGSQSLGSSTTPGATECNTYLVAFESLN